MRSRSAPGSSTPTSRRLELNQLPRYPGTWLLGAVLVVVAGIYVVYAFVAPSPLLRIVMRSAPFVPLAVWTIWLDAKRPLEAMPPVIRIAGRFALLLLVMSVVVLVLGLGLNWLYDPNRIS